MEAVEHLSGIVVVASHVGGLLSVRHILVGEQRGELPGFLGVIFGLGEGELTSYYNE